MFVFFTSKRKFNLKSDFCFLLFSSVTEQMRMHCFNQLQKREEEEKKEEDEKDEVEEEEEKEGGYQDVT